MPKPANATRQPHSFHARPYLPAVDARPGHPSKCSRHNCPALPTIVITWRFGPGINAAFRAQDLCQHHGLERISHLQAHGLLPAEPLKNL